MTTGQLEDVGLNITESSHSSEKVPVPVWVQFHHVKGTGNAPVRDMRPVDALVTENFTQALPATSAGVVIAMALASSQVPLEPPVPPLPDVPPVLWLPPVPDVPPLPAGPPPEPELPPVPPVTPLPPEALSVPPLELPPEP
jgi:hypothetical protein